MRRALLALLLVGCAHKRPPPCYDDTFVLRALRAGPTLRRLYLPVTFDGQPGELFVDSGSARSFVFSEVEGEGWAPPSGKLEIGCHRFAPLRRRRSGHLAQSIGAIGVYGADGLFSSAATIDLRTGALHFGPEAKTPPSPTSIPLEIVHGIPITTLVVDGQPRRLMIDTGTADLLLLDAPPADAELHEVRDSTGRVIRFATGSAEITWPGGVTRTVPAWRTEHHPAFERHRAELGVPLDGLLGLSAFEDATLAVRPGARVLELRFPVR